jgi:hypothetical protein
MDNLRVHIAVLKRGEVCPMPVSPSALCQIVPHVTEKSYKVSGVEEMSEAVGARVVYLSRQLTRI